MNIRIANRRYFVAIETGPFFPQKILLVRQTRHKKFENIPLLSKDAVRQGDDSLGIGKIDKSVPHIAFIFEVHAEVQKVKTTLFSSINTVACIAG